MVVVPSTESLTFPRSLNGALTISFIILPIPLILPNKLLSSTGFLSSVPATSVSEDSPSDENDCLANIVGSAQVIVNPIAGGKYLPLLNLLFMRVKLLS